MAEGRRREYEIVNVGSLPQDKQTEFSGLDVKAVIVEKEYGSFKITGMFPVIGFDLAGFLLSKVKESVTSEQLRDIIGERV